MNKIIDTILKISRIRKITPTFTDKKPSLEHKRETRTQELIRRFKYNKAAVFGLILILFLVFLAIFADVIAPNDPTPSPPNLEYSLKPGFWSNEGLSKVCPLALIC